MGFLSILICVFWLVIYMLRQYVTRNVKDLVMLDGDDAIGDREEHNECSILMRESLRLTWLLP